MQTSGRPRRDPKTRLQEWAQGRGLPLPRYEVVERTGPDHAPEFKVRVELPGVPESFGKGRSIRDGEQAAARAALQAGGIAPDWAERP
jgi:ribonuclease-3